MADIRSGFGVWHRDIIWNPSVNRLIPNEWNWFTCCSLHWRIERGRAPPPFGTFWKGFHKNSWFFSIFALPPQSRPPPPFRVSLYAPGSLFSYCSNLTLQHFLYILLILSSLWEVKVSPLRPPMSVGLVRVVCLSVFISLKGRSTLAFSYRSTC